MAEALHGARLSYESFSEDPVLREVLSKQLQRDFHILEGVHHPIDGRHTTFAEHSKNLNDDGRRAYQVLRKSANQNHPFSNFSTGCLETLQVPRIRERLLSFWRDRYDPENMTVCLVSSRSLDDLELLLAEHFSGIRRAPDAADACEEAPPALFAATGIVHERKPVRDLRELRIMWPLPFGLRDDYRNGAERIVGHALGATLRHSFTST